jgi:hypothetical protein
MAVVRRQKGDKTKVNANGVLVITRANGNVIKINAQKGTITRLKADGTVVRQKTEPGKLPAPVYKRDKERSRRGNELQPVYKRDKTLKKQKKSGPSKPVMKQDTVTKTKPYQRNRRGGR